MSDGSYNSRRPQSHEDVDQRLPYEVAESCITSLRNGLTLENFRRLTQIGELEDFFPKVRPKDITYLHNLIHANIVGTATYLAALQQAISERRVEVIDLPPPSEDAGSFPEPNEESNISLRYVSIPSLGVEFRDYRSEDVRPVEGNFNFDARIRANCSDTRTLTLRYVFFEYTDTDIYNVAHDKLHGKGQTFDIRDSGNRPILALNRDFTQQNSRLFLPGYYGVSIKDPSQATQIASATYTKLALTADLLTVAIAQATSVYEK